MKSLITGSWSWNGFARSLLIGAITGGIGGSFLGIYSATSFNGAVVLGSLNGAIGGGVDAIFSGQNFFKSLYDGAVAGAAFGGISFAIKYLFTGQGTLTEKRRQNSPYQVQEMVATDRNTIQGNTRADFNINTVKNLDGTDPYKGQFIRGSYHIVDETSDLSEFLQGEGYTSDGNFIRNGDRKIFGLTEPVTHNGKLVYQRIYLSKASFSSLQQLDLTMGHEILHSIYNNARLTYSSTDAMQQSHNIQEHFKARWEDAYIKSRGWGKLDLSVELYDNYLLDHIQVKNMLPRMNLILNNYIKSTTK
ncbi:hypothetical protein [Halpernia sp. GG3]